MATRVFQNPVWRARRGAAALEFAIIMPVLIIVLTSVADLTHAILTGWQVDQAADAIGRIATSRAVTQTNANLLTQDDARIASTAVFPLVTGLSGTLSPQAGVVMSVVVFTTTVAGCTQNCSYVANVAWSAPLQGGLARRACGVLAPAPDSAKPSPTTLPASAFTADPVLVVDVATDFTPVITTLLGPLLHVAAAGLMSTRSGAPGDWIHISGPTAAGLYCPGYT